jgi:hypothetical protein
MMKKQLTLVLSLCLLSLLMPAVAFAQQEGPALGLGLIRNFGYGGGRKIQGNFTLRIVDPPDELAEVSFFMDDKLMEVVSVAPFQIQFSTGEFEDGEHQMSARGIFEDGSEVTTNTITKTFLSAEQAWAETQGIIFPLLIGIGALTLLGIGVPVLLGRKKEHVPGKYGPAGGAVCPRCQLPFARPFLAPNMAVGKLVRCPHCGKISILPRAGSSSLQAAEERLAGDGVSQIERGSQDDFQQLIEDSRFED